MPLKNEIQNFLADVDPKILARGKDYYLSGYVENLERNGEKVTAEVSGSDVTPYVVEIELTPDGGVEDWLCDCPYDLGPVCKHTVAVLLGLQEEVPENPQKKTSKGKVSIQKLVEQASME